MNRLLRNVAGWALLGASCLAVAQAGGDATPMLKPLAAMRTPASRQAMLLGAASAGPRQVAVGEEGVVLLSDDGGRRWRQARSVPVSATLTSVSFADARHGWAVGHWGVILATADGGETWTVQRLAVGEDRPLFAVHFLDAEHGVAVGLWSLVLTTEDGGRTWTPRTLAPPPGSARADANLLALFTDPAGHLYAAGERGLVLRSDDRGATWTGLPTGYKGSFWTGTALADGTLLVAGQRGTLYRGEAGGTAWSRVETGTRNSITAVAARGEQVVIAGLDGLSGRSEDGGRSFHVAVADDRLSRTAVLPGPSGDWLVMSRRGPLAPMAGR